MTTETALDQQVSIHVLRSVEEDPTVGDAAAPADNLFCSALISVRWKHIHPKASSSGMPSFAREICLGVVYTQLLLLQRGRASDTNSRAVVQLVFFSTFGQFLRGLVARQVGFYLLVCGNLMLSGEHGIRLPG